MNQAEYSPQPLGLIVRRTTIVEAARLSDRLGVQVTIASETFQHTGSFKFRAAYNLASKVSERKIITASSGNFGQAMAYACRLLGKACTVVMPATSAQVKIDAVREYGGAVDLIDVMVKGRAARVAELASENPDAYIASAFDDPLVIEGNASLGAEIAALDREFDFVIAPVGGGGLTSGIINGLGAAQSRARVVGAEPLMANDAARSLRAGHIVLNESEPQTIADGARTVSVGQHNWAILKEGLSKIVEVPEENIKEGVQLLFALANLKAEPTGALGVGALLTEPESFRDARVCCVVSGGNVDPEVYRNILAS
ncbi:MAG TPA: pyridoxal-phosphate dependent enzyme, partial [Blastocatellia bacterium]|nr:pyridoxal-phosphate dependent enzyme [Blastocatellia bacterium]